MLQLDRIISQAFTLGIACLLATTGCSASFSGGTLPKLTYGQIVSRDLKPSISYDEVFVELGAGSDAETNQRPVPMLSVFHNTIEDVFKRSHLFSEINPENPQAEYNISLLLQRNGEYDAYFSSKSATPIQSLSSLYAGFLSVYTLGIIPYHTKIEYLLAVDIKKKDDLLKKYEYKENMYTCVQTPFLLFWSWTNTPNKVQKEIVERMLLVFLSDMEKDGLLAADDHAQVTHK